MGKPSSMEIRSRHRELLRRLWHSGPASRSELASKMGIRPNTVGDLAGELIEARVLTEGESEIRRVGRPKIPLSIDPGSRRLLGMAISPGNIRVLPLDLLGRPSSLPDGSSDREMEPSQASRPIELAAELLAETMDPSVLAIGLTVTGFVDRRARQILFSSILPSERSISLEKLWQVAGDIPIVVGNDMHAQAAHWLMRKEHSEEDALLVQFGDGSLGAIHLIQGRPSSGSITSANELGHNRFFVDTEICYCGRVGCLERICSLPFLVESDRRLGLEPVADDFLTRMRTYEVPADDPSLDKVLDYLALGISNAINFTRPHRLILVTPLTAESSVTKAVTDRIRAAVLPALSDRLAIDVVDPPVGGGAEIAAWLALAGLYREGWSWQ